MKCHSVIKIINNDEDKCQKMGIRYDEIFSNEKEQRNKLLIQHQGWIAKNIMLTIKEHTLYDSIYRMFSNRQN